MSPAIRAKVMSLAKTHGFTVSVKEDGQDLYVKNMVLTHRTQPARIYIDKEVGIQKSSGKVNYFKVAVHPNAFQPELAEPRSGVSICVNSRTKTNRHHSSNYTDYPVDSTVSVEPYGMCYRAEHLQALDTLLSKFVRSCNHF